VCLSRRCRVFEVQRVLLILGSALLAFALFFACEFVRDGAFILCRRGD
jgi:hypothetical protein